MKYRDNYEFDSIESVVEALFNSINNSDKVYDHTLMNILTLLIRDSLYILHINEERFLKMLSKYENFDSFTFSFNMILDSIFIHMSKNKKDINHDSIIKMVGLDRAYEIKIKLMIKISEIFLNDIEVTNTTAYSLYSDALTLILNEYGILESIVLNILDTYVTDINMQPFNKFAKDMMNIYLTYMLNILNYTSSTILLESIIKTHLDFTFKIFVRYVEKIRLMYILEIAKSDMVGKNFFKKISKKYIPKLFSKINNIIK